MSSDITPTRNRGTRQHLRRMAMLSTMALAVLCLPTCLLSTDAQAATGHHGPPITQLRSMFAAKRGLTLAQIGAVRVDSVHQARVRGTTWAIVQWLPAVGDSPAIQTRFQDGQGTGIFSKAAGGSWRMVGVGADPLACDGILPAAARGAWHLKAPDSCTASAASQRAEARRAIAALDRLTTNNTVSSSDSIAIKAAKLALSQVGVSDNPATQNWGLDCNPYTAIDGPTIPNSSECGWDSAHKVMDENEQWCADFAKWVWVHAGVDNNLNNINAGAGSFWGWGIDQGQNLQFDGNDPQVGDAVMFFPAGTTGGDNGADHVGIITGVNADGTVNIVNGDFMNSKTVSVAYDPKVNLATFGANVWNPGEMWVLVQPPNSERAQPPSLTATGPSQAVVGTATSFSASAHSSHGIGTVIWAFGDGGSASGTHVTHVFRNPGWQTVTVTVTSKGNNVKNQVVATKNIDVDVVGQGSAAADAADPAYEFTAQPVNWMLFFQDAEGGLDQAYWWPTAPGELYDGSGWDDMTIAGKPEANSPLTQLNYADTASGWNMDQHVFFVDTSGALSETTGSGQTWANADIAGTPATGSQLSAVTTDAGGIQIPHVFYVNSAGRLAQSTQNAAGVWRAATIGGSPMSTTALTSTPYVAGASTGVRVYYLTTSGAVAQAQWNGRRWSLSELKLGKDAPATNTSLAVQNFGTDGRSTRLFYVDGAGRLTQATRSGRTWKVEQLPGDPGQGTRLLASTYLQSNGALQLNVFYMTPDGDPAEDSSTTGGRASTWTFDTLGGTADQLLAISAYPDNVQGQSLYMTYQGGIYDENFTPVNGTWYPAQMDGSVSTPPSN